MVDHSLPEPETPGSSLADKMGAYFKTLTLGKFVLKDTNVNKNLRQKTDQTPTPDDESHQKRQEHQVLVACAQFRVVLLHANPFLGKISMFRLDPAEIYPYEK